MYRLISHGKLAALVILMAFPVHAKGVRQDTNLKAFLLRGPTKPTPVVSMKDATKNEQVFMRMPDLGIDNAVVKDIAGNERPEESEKVIFAHEKKLKNRARGSKSILKESSPRSDKTASKPIRFGTVKISGTLRLPRVKFARVGISMDLRDETPSLDFTQKSLKDSDF